MTSKCRPHFSCCSGLIFRASIHFSFLNICVFSEFMPPGLVQGQAARQAVVAAGGVFTDLMRWRLLGAAAWACCVLASGQALFTILLLALGEDSGWSLLGPRGCALLLLQLAVMFGHSRVLSASEAAPLHAPKLGLPSGSLVSTLLSRVVLRQRRIGDVLGVACLYVSTCTCSVLYAYSHPSPGSHSTSLWWSLVYGCTMGVMYSTQHLARYSAWVAMRDGPCVWIQKQRQRVIGMPALASS